MNESRRFMAAVLPTVILMISPGESDADDIDLPAGARIGIIAMLPTDVTHFHVGKSQSESFMRTYRLEWPAADAVDTPLAQQLRNAGFEPVFLDPTAPLRRQSRPWIISRPQDSTLPRAAMKEIEGITTAENLQALVIVAPGQNNNPASVQGNRLRRLPTYVQGWGFSTSDEPDGIARPVAFNLTQMLLIGKDGGDWDLAVREWGGDFVYEWSDFDPGADLKTLPQSEIDKLRPVITDVMQRQISRLMPHIKVAG